jgi:ATP-binding cassette subfamily C (CFTR/MRP) protein 1
VASYFPCTTVLRGLFVPAIYRKALDLGVSDLDDKAAMILMSTDLERISSGYAIIHELWANLVQIVRCMFIA